VTAPLLQMPTSGCSPWAVRAAGSVLTVSLLGWHPQLVLEYVAGVHETPDTVTLDVQQSVQQQPGQFWFTSGHVRHATAVLSAPLGPRELLDPDGRRLPVVDAAELLEPSSPWRLAAEEYHTDPRWSWESRYTDGARHVTVKQGSPALTHVEWDRTFFTPRLLERPEVRGHSAVLFTFAGEASNLVLTWRECDRGVSLQALGGLDGDDLIQLGNALRADAQPAEPYGSRFQ